MTRANRIVAVATIGAGLLIAGCGGGGAVTTITVSATSPADSLDTTPSADGNTETGIDAGASDVAMGGVGRDGGLQFRVTSVNRSSTQIPVQEYAERVAPAKGAEFIIADVVVKNIGQTSSTPFCGASGTVLIDLDGKNYDPINSLYSIAGNDALCEKLNPGFKRSVRLVYEVPKNVTTHAIALWDTEENGDYNGQTWVRVAVNGQ